MGGKVSKQSIEITSQLKKYEKKLVLPKQSIDVVGVVQTTIINDYTFIRTSWTPGLHQLHIFKQDAYLRSMPLNQHDILVFVTESHLWLQRYSNLPPNDMQDDSFKDDGAVVYNFQTDEFLKLPLFSGILSYTMGSIEFGSITYSEEELRGKIIHLRLFTHSFKPRDYISAIDGNKFWAAYDIRDDNGRYDCGLVQFEIKNNSVTCRNFVFKVPVNEMPINVNHFFPFGRNKVLYFYPSQEGVMMKIAEIDEAKGELRPVPRQIAKAFIGGKSREFDIYPSDDARHVMLFQIIREKKFLQPHKERYSCYRFLSLDEHDEWQLDTVDPQMSGGRFVPFSSEGMPKTYKAHNPKVYFNFRTWLKQNYFCMAICNGFQIFKVEKGTIIHLGSVEAPQIWWRELGSDGYAVWAQYLPLPTDEKNAVISLSISFVPCSELSKDASHKQIYSSLLAFFQHAVPGPLLNVITEYAVDPPFPDIKKIVFPQ